MSTSTLIKVILGVGNKPCKKASQAFYAGSGVVTKGKYGYFLKFRIWSESKGFMDIELSHDNGETWKKCNSPMAIASAFKIDEDYKVEKDKTLSPENIEELINRLPDFLFYTNIDEDLISEITDPEDRWEAMGVVFDADEIIIRGESEWDETTTHEFKLITEVSRELAPRETLEGWGSALSKYIIDTPKKMSMSKFEVAPKGGRNARKKAKRQVAVAQAAISPANIAAENAVVEVVEEKAEPIKTYNQLWGKLKSVPTEDGDSHLG